MKAIRFTAGAQSDVGLVRHNNEDNFLIMDLTSGEFLAENISDHVLGEHGSLFLVADGMGGGAAGEIASRMAVEFIARELLDAIWAEAVLDHKEFSKLFKASIECANQAVFEEAQRDTNLKGMGTTLTAVAVYDARIFFGQLGDSRAYLIRNGSIAQMTQDQSLVAQLVASGALTPEEAKTHPQRNIILQALGLQEAVDVTMTYGDLKHNDRLVLCSDGLSGKLGPEELNEIVHTWARPKDACQRLVELARERGGEDNITVIVASFEGEGLAPPSSEEMLNSPKTQRKQHRRFWFWGGR